MTAAAALPAEQTCSAVPLRCIHSEKPFSEADKSWTAYIFNLFLPSDVYQVYVHVLDRQEGRKRPTLLVRPVMAIPESNRTFEYVRGSFSSCPQAAAIDAYSAGRSSIDWELMRNLNTVASAHNINELAEKVFAARPGCLIFERSRPYMGVMSAM